MLSRVCGLRRTLVVLGIVLLLVITGVIVARAEPAVQTSNTGEQVFVAQCNGCHTIGGGVSFGPDLDGVAEKESQEWLVSFISDPHQLIASGDPIATALLSQYNNFVMPTLGLSQDQVLAVISYIETQSSINQAPVSSLTPAASSTPVSSISPGASAGNIDNGRAIFIEQVPLANGGPPCIGCHSIDNTGLLGGGTLGPNLSQASVKYGSGLSSVLSNITFPSMGVIFAGKPLTATETADLVAFIQSAAGQPPVNREPWVLGLSAAGFLGVLVLAAIIWRGRLNGVRTQLVKRSKSPPLGKARGQE